MPDPDTADKSLKSQEISLKALPLFLEKGYAGTSMSAIARVAGITKATLYHHFASKEDLFVAATVADPEGLMDDLRRLSEDRTSDPEARMRAALRICYDMIVESPAGRLTSVIAETAGRIPAVATGFYTRFIVPFEIALNAIHADGVASGQFRPMPQHHVHALVAGPLLEISLGRAMWAATPEIASARAHQTSPDAYIDMLMGTLLATA
ncbi:TetR/AcrR family transcriptional regulator [Aestuariibius sp. 2305UL40-4]|uniref:TetR/AcrR family transcriptional regulator n=1 Tax=Aestuariibius violaceus TaxID=3234132 RepID=UPI00345EB97E